MQRVDAKRTNQLIVKGELFQPKTVRFPEGVSGIKLRFFAQGLILPNVRQDLLSVAVLADEQSILEGERKG